MLLLLPEILVSCCIILLLVMLCVKPHLNDTKAICALAYFMLISGSYILYLSISGIEKTILMDNYLIDKTALALKGIVIFASGLIILYIKQYLISYNIFKIEFFALFFLSIFGQLICISSAHTLTTYLGIELMALPIYGLVAFNHIKLPSIEATIKYMVLGGIASAFLLYGISMVYGATASLTYSGISLSIQDNSYNHTLMLFGIIFIIAGLCFKLGLVPFHMWAPDVYEGGNTASTIIISTIPKIAVFALSYNLLVHVFGNLAADYSILLQIIAISSLLIANLTAIMQKNLKRMLAYSTISHMAFILFSIIASYNTPINNLFVLHAAIFYIVVYVFTGIALFAIILGLNLGKDNLMLDDIKGLAKKYPMIGFAILISMFSLAGIPPTLGFYAKLLIIQSLMQNYYYMLSIIAIISSVIAAFYYLRLVKILYFDDINENLPKFIQTKSSKIFISLNFFILIVLGIYPKPLSSFINLILS